MNTRKRIMKRCFAGLLCAVMLVFQVMPAIYAAEETAESEPPSIGVTEETPDPEVGVGDESDPDEDLPEAGDEDELGAPDENLDAPDESSDAADDEDTPVEEDIPVIPPPLPMLTAEAEEDEEDEEAPGDIAPFPWGGAGTPDEPYLITTASGLKALYVAVNENISPDPEAPAPNGYGGTYFALEQDIDLDELGALSWTPIGSSDVAFKGKFDGRNHTISNLLITDTDADAQGLFGFVAGADIRNLTVEGSVKGHNNVGGIAGYATATSTFTNCVNNSDVEGTGSNIGGILGGTAAGSAITECVNNGAISGVSNVGGILGSGAASSNSISKSVNNGAVTGTDINVGGICGNLNQNIASNFIEDCLNAGDITGIGYMGAILGYARSLPSDNSTSIKVNYSYNSGNVGGELPKDSLFIGNNPTGDKTGDRGDGQDGYTVAQTVYALNANGIRGAWGIENDTPALALGAVPAQYAIMPTHIENASLYVGGTEIPEPLQAPVGATVTVNPVSGYFIKQLTAREQSAGASIFVNNAGVSAAFTMPGTWVTLSPVIVEDPGYEEEGVIPVVLHRNGGEFTVPPVSAEAPDDATLPITTEDDTLVWAEAYKIYENPGEITKATDDNTDYDFAGWFTDDEFSELHDFGSLLILPPEATQLDLYAKWSEVDKRNVFFDVSNAPSGEGALIPSGEAWNDGRATGYRGHTIADPGNVNRTAPYPNISHEFVGWYATKNTADDRTPWDFDNDVIPGDLEADTFTLYARWSVTDFFDAGDATQDGSETKPFIISSADLLRGFAADVNGAVTNTWNGAEASRTPKSFAGKHFVLSSDIDLGGEGTPFAPAGENGKPFSGVLDGAGKTVSGLYVTGRSYAGLFGYISGATVKNITVAGAISGGSYVGGIAGYADGNALIENAVSNVNITGVTNCAGGIAGAVAGGAKVLLCVNNGNLSGNNYIGGIIGDASVVEAAVRCVNNGNIASVAALSGAGPYVGGIIARGSAAGVMAFDCINTGTVSGATGNAGTFSYNCVSTIIGGPYGTAATPIAKSCASSVGGRFAGTFRQQQGGRYVTAGCTETDCSAYTPGNNESVLVAVYTLNASGTRGAWTVTDGSPALSDNEHPGLYVVSFSAPLENGGLYIDGNSVMESPASVYQVKAGETLALKPNDGHALVYFTAKFGDEDINPASYSPEAGVVFEMPAGKVTIATIIGKAAEDADELLPVIFHRNGGLFVPGSEPTGQTPLEGTGLPDGYNADSDTLIYMKAYDALAEPAEGAITKATDSNTSYTFSGWYADPECTLPYDFRLGLTDRLDLYAKWTEDGLRKLAFDVSNAQGESLSTPGEDGDVAWSAPGNATGYLGHTAAKFADTPDTPYWITRSPHVTHGFLGWFTTKNGSATDTPWDFENDKLPDELTGDTFTLYARWTTSNLFIEGTKDIEPGEEGYQDGTAEYPFLIENSALLRGLSDDIQATAYVNKDNGDGTGIKAAQTFAGTYFKLTGDIDLGGSSNPFTPVGTDATKYFGGVFDGAEHTISNVYINRSVNHTGLFGYIKDAEIKNLSLDGSVGGSQYVGGVAGYAAGVSKITDCVNNATVSASSNTAGGILGEFIGGAGAVLTLTGNLNTGTVTGSGNYSYNVGGIVGNLADSASDAANDISRNGNTGAVSGKGSYAYNYTTWEISYFYGVGGIAGTLGANYGSAFNNNWNTGAITDGTNPIVGGVAGAASSDISYCYTLGDIRVTSLPSASVEYIGAGGIVGRLSAGTITHCFAGGSLGAVNNVTTDGLYGPITKTGADATNYYAMSYSINGGGLPGGTEGPVALTIEQRESGEAAYRMDGGDTDTRLGKWSLTADKPVAFAWETTGAVYKINYSYDSETDFGRIVVPVYAAAGSTVHLKLYPDLAGDPGMAITVTGDPDDFTINDARTAATFTMPSEDVELTAEFTDAEIPEETEFTVTFWDLDSEYSDLRQSVKAGDKAERPSPDPAQPGANFLGWYLDGEPYDFEWPVKRDLALVAQWEYYNAVVVSFNINRPEEAAGSEQPPARTLEKNTSLAEPETPDWVGTGDGFIEYVFTGWYTSTGQKWNFSDFVTQSMTLTARWTVDSYLAKDSTESAPFELTNENFDLLRIVSAAATASPQASSGGLFQFEERYFALGENINIGADWEPVAYFGGHLDGNGYTVLLSDAKTPMFLILGLPAKLHDLEAVGHAAPESYTRYGAFACDNYGEIRDSHVEISGVFTGQSLSGSQASWTVGAPAGSPGVGAYGGFVGYNAGRLANLTAKVDFKSVGGYTGGIVGAFFTGSEITGCTTLRGSRIETSDRASSDISGAAGGIAGGGNSTGMGGGSDSSIANCANFADYIKAGIGGGIVGSAPASFSITNCLNAAPVSNGSGLVGSDNGTSVGQTYTQSGTVAPATSYAISPSNPTGSSSSGLYDCYGIGSVSLDGGNGSGGRMPSYSYAYNPDAASKGAAATYYNASGSSVLTSETVVANGALLNLLNGNGSRSVWHQSKRGYPVIWPEHKITVVVKGADGAALDLGENVFIDAEDGAGYAWERDTVTVTVPTGNGLPVLKKLTVAAGGGAAVDITAAGNFNVTADAVLTAEFDKTFTITSEITGLKNGANLYVSDVAAGEEYYAGLDEVVTVRVTLLPHPVVPGATSAEYVLKSLTVVFEDGSRLDITDSYSFIARDNAKVIAEIGEIVVFPVNEGGGGDGPGGGTGDGDGDGDGTGSGDGSGDGDGSGNGDGDGTGNGAGAGPGAASGTGNGAAGNVAQPADNTRESNTGAAADTAPQQSAEQQAPEQASAEQRVDRQAPVVLPPDLPEEIQEQLAPQEETNETPPEEIIEEEPELPMSEEPDVTRDEAQSPMPIVIAIAAVVVAIGAGIGLTGARRRLFTKK